MPGDASGVTDFLSGTAGSNFFGSSTVGAIAEPPETPKAVLTVSITELRSAGATVLLDK